MCVFYTCILSCVSISLSIDTYRLSRPCSTCFKAPYWSDSNHHSPSARYHPGLVVDVQFSHLGMHAFPTLLPEGHVGLAMGRGWFPSKWKMWSVEHGDIHRWFEMRMRQWGWARGGTHKENFTVSNTLTNETRWTKQPTYFWCFLCGKERECKTLAIYTSNRKSLLLHSF